MKRQFRKAIIQGLKLINRLQTGDPSRRKDIFLPGFAPTAMRNPTKS
jgi:hypothetical protein